MLLEIPFLHRMMREMGRCVDGYIVETERQRKWLVQRWAIPADMIAIVPPGFDAGVIQSAYQSASKQASPGVVFSGRLHRWKGVYELLQVFSSLAQEHPEWNLHFVGDGPARLRLQEQVQERRLQKQVVFWGRKPYDQALSIVASAEVFVLPSYIESFPLSLLEAMALGVPAIATDVGGIRDHLIKNDVTGLLVSSKDLKALRHALTRLISNPELRRNLGVNGQVRVRHQTLDKMVSSTVGCYTRLLSEGSGANPGSVR
jgi:glycosyltransferase involved in cell wall biosynthesis